MKQAYKTFIRRGMYMNHDSDSPEKAVGIILDSKYWDSSDTKYVECLSAIDKSQKIAGNIENGIATDVSMGALVDNCICNICDKVATNESEYCLHLRDYMGKDYNGKKVYAINRGVNFYELSIVSTGANNSAKILQCLAALKSNGMERYGSIDRESKLKILGHLDALVDIITNPKNNSHV